MKDFHYYYQQTLQQLRHSGREYALANPKLAPYLAEPSQDPDVERLLEGFAYLTASLQQNVDAHFPEVTRDFLANCFPQFLRPQPSSAVVALTPADTLPASGATVAAGQSLSLTAAGRSFTFQTAVDVTVLPLRLDQLQAQQLSKVMTIDLDFHALQSLSVDASTPLRFYLGGGRMQRYQLYHGLTKRCHRVSIIQGEHETVLPQARFQAVGAPITARPWSGTSGYHPYQCLQDWFALPEQFSFVELNGLSWQCVQKGDWRLRIVCHCDTDDVFPIDQQGMQLFCVPVTNLFPWSAKPFQKTQQTDRYRLEAEAGEHGAAAIFDVVSVEAWLTEQQRRQAYQAYVAQSEVSSSASYALQWQQNACRSEPDLWLVLPNADAEKAVMSLDVWAYQPDLPEHVRLGDGNTCASSAVKQFTLVTMPSWPVYPPLSGQVHWHLVRFLQLGCQGVATLTQFQQWLACFHYAVAQGANAQTGLQHYLKALTRFHIRPAEKVMKAYPLRGQVTTVEFKQGAFLHPGEQAMFNDVLQAIWSDMAALNSFHDVVLQVS